MTKEIQRLEKIIQKKEENLREIYCSQYSRFKAKKKSFRVICVSYGV